MSLEVFLTEFRERVVGRVVRQRRLAGNSLLVYVECEPGDHSGHTLWFEPTWHLRDQTAVLTGSRQAQHDPDASDPDAGFNVAADAVDRLKGRTVLSLEVAPVTFDLTLHVSGGLSVSTFVSDPTTDELWHIRDNTTKVKLIRTGAAFEIISPEV
jgi:hypothetical protein